MSRACRWTDYRCSERRADCKVVSLPFTSSILFVRGLDSATQLSSTSAVFHLPGARGFPALCSPGNVVAVTRWRPECLLLYNAASAILTRLSAIFLTPGGTESRPHSPKLAVTSTLRPCASKVLLATAERNLRATSSARS